MLDTTVEFNLANCFYLAAILIGLLLVLAGMYISIYSKSGFADGRKLNRLNKIRYISGLERALNKTPLRLISERIDKAIAYFMLEEQFHRKTVVTFSVLLPLLGILLYLSLNTVLTLWYTKLVTFMLCMVVPYYILTLIIDYMKYKLRLKIPQLIDNFRSSFMTHYRIKPALSECSKSLDKSLGRIISRASDSSDINESLCRMRERINDTWFNIFILLLVNYRENGGELIAQLYKLNRTITRYNNLEKKKNKRLIWYEIFAVGVSIFSLPVIILINKMILGVSPGLYYNTTAVFSKIVIYSLAALIIVRVLRRM